MAVPLATDAPISPAKADRVNGDGLPDGCPTPLKWTEVLATYRRDSQSWSVSVDGDRVSGRSFGSGPPLYLLSGIAGSGDLYCLLSWVLRDDFRCVVPEYRSAPHGKLSAERLACDLFASADANRHERFSVFAPGFGTAVALTALLQQPRRIERAVLVSGFARRRLSQTERLLSSLGGWLSGSLSRFKSIEAVYRTNYSRGFPPFDSSRWEFFMENVGKTPLKEVSARGRLLSQFDLRRRLDEIRQPILSLSCEHEGKVAAACREEMERGMPNVTCERLPSMGALGYLTHPHRLAKSIRSFINDLSIEPCCSPGATDCSESSNKMSP